MTCLYVHDEVITVPQIWRYGVFFGGNDISDTTREKEQAENLAELQALRDQFRKEHGLVEAEPEEEGDEEEEEESGDEEEEEESGDEEEGDEEGDLKPEIEYIEELGDPKYYTVSGTVVRVEYENGSSFILNYNSYDVKAVYNGETIEIDALGFVRIDSGKGEVKNG